MKFDLLKQLTYTKNASKDIALLSADKKREILVDIAEELLLQKDAIMQANMHDVEDANKKKKNSAFIDRLTLSDTTFANMAEQVRSIAKQKDDIGEIIESKTLANGVMLQKMRVALGVVGIIYESRPNVTIDVTALCIKSGNAVILRGGSDAFRTNSLLVGCVYTVLKKHNVNRHIVGFVRDTDRKLVTQMLQQNTFLDVIIPRGGYDLVKKVVKESKIAVLYHASGGARIYVDKSADIDLAVSVCVNAKISRPATCNSLDTILVHQAVAKEFLQKFQSALAGKAEIRADKKSLQYIVAKEAMEKDYATEFLDYVVSIKIVKDEKEALNHIAKYTNHHSEGVIAEDTQVIAAFVQSVDAAALFVNCSTRLHDGGVFELGAEMGIATGKLHARGPVGVKEMTTYKWIAYGKGQIRE